MNGIANGSIYALLGVGLGLVWGVMKILNIAHAAIAFLGTYVALTMLEFYGVDPMISIVAFLPLFFVIGVLLQRFLVQSTSSYAEIGVNLFLAFYGMMLIFENAQVVVWTASERILSPPYANFVLDFGLLILPFAQLISITVACITLLAIYLFLEKTLVGKALRAAAADREAAWTMGIHVNSLYMVAFGIAAATAMEAGVVMGLNYSFFPGLQLTWIIKSFLVVVLGGTDRIEGIFGGGMILGVAEALVGGFLPLYFVDYVAYVALFVVLTVRPSGLKRVM